MAAHKESLRERDGGPYFVIAISDLIHKMLIGNISTWPFWIFGFTSSNISEISGLILAHFFQINCSLTKRVDFVAAVVFVVAIQSIIKQKINKCSVNSFSFSLRLRLELEFAHSWVHPWTLTASFHRANARIRCSRHHGSAF